MREKLLSGKPHSMISHRGHLGRLVAIFAAQSRPWISVATIYARQWWLTTAHRVNQRL